MTSHFMAKITEADSAERIIKLSLGGHFLIHQEVCRCWMSNFVGRMENYFIGICVVKRNGNIYNIDRNYHFPYKIINSHVQWMSF